MDGKCYYLCRRPADGAKYPQDIINLPQPGGISAVGSDVLGGPSTALVAVNGPSIWEIEMLQSYPDVHWPPPQSSCLPAYRGGMEKRTRGRESVSGEEELARPETNGEPPSCTVPESLLVLLPLANPAEAHVLRTSKN
jgi:hypothetical protein